jgi:hypothetical protein
VCPARVLRADPWLERIRCYRELVAAGHAEAVEAEAEYPDLARAAHLEQCPETTFRLRLLSLAGVPIEEIAERIGISPGTIETWQRVFFDLADFRDRRDWVEIHVCAPEQAAGRGDIAVQYRMALVGGPLVAGHLLDVGPPADEADRVRKRRERLDLMTERAISMVLQDRRDAMKFIEFAHKVRSDERRLERDEQKLAHCVLEDARRHERGLFVARLRQESIDRRRRPATGCHTRGAEHPVRHGGARPGESAASSATSPTPSAPAPVAPIGAAADGGAQRAAAHAQAIDRDVRSVATCLTSALAPPAIDDDRAVAPTPTTRAPQAAMPGGV